MTKRSRLEKLLEVFEPNRGTAVDFSTFDADIARLKEALTEKIQARTVEDVHSQLEKFKKKLNFKGMLEAIDKLEASLDIKIKGLTGLLNEETASLKKLLTTTEEVSSEKIASFASSIEEVKKEIAKTLEQKDKEVGQLKDKIEKLLDFSISTQDSFLEITKTLNKLEDDDKGVAELADKLEKIRLELINKINNLPRGGGNANRNIAIGGNTSVLNRYTDINIKAGSNVTLTYSNNNTTKYLDLTIASSGGGGSVSGTVRSINRVSTSQAMGNTSGTDYVYIATSGILLTLPDAASNTNLYTVKNVAASSVLITTSAAQTIDGSANLILATQYTSVDLVNDGNDNWGIT